MSRFLNIKPWQTALIGCCSVIFFIHGDASHLRRVNQAHVQYKNQHILELEAYNAAHRYANDPPSQQSDMPAYNFVEPEILFSHKASRILGMLFIAVSVVLSVVGVFIGRGSVAIISSIFVFIWIIGLFVSGLTD